MMIGAWTIGSTARRGWEQWERNRRKRLGGVEEIEEDLSCPMCGYNLRGLREARCPECGYACDWEDLIDPARRLHPYLFEHHPEKNVRSFLRTAVGTLLPRRFWRDLHPAQPGDRRRLIGYWCVAAGVYLLGVMGLTLVLSFNDARARVASNTPALQISMRKHYEQIRGPYCCINGQYVTLDEFLEDTFPTMVTSRQVWKSYRRTFFGELKYLVVVMLMWPWLTFGGLLVFRWSMRRAKVFNIHVLRCVLYGFDLILWIGGAFIVLGLVAFLAPGFNPTANMSGREWAIVLCVGNYRVWTAYRRYLQFQHPFATILASQVIVLLLLMPIYTFDFVNLIYQWFWYYG